MSAEPFRYDRMVEDALRGVVRRTLSTVAEQGLPGNHHLYVTFRTHAAGVDIPDYLRERYPKDMTIVLQYKFWGLEIDDVGFEITLSFNKINERLRIPFDSITAFADPSVNFGLQFNVPEHAVAEVTPVQPPTETAQVEPEVVDEDNEPPEEPPAGEKVVTLDAFRKK